MTEEDADTLVRSIDTDGNGEVDVDEFITLIRDAM
jgi:Ca2+-binding EF-hand superfamily protein